MGGARGVMNRRQTGGERKRARPVQSLGCSHRSGLGDILLEIVWLCEHGILSSRCLSACLRLELSSHARWCTQVFPSLRVVSSNKGPAIRHSGVCARVASGWVLAGFSESTGYRTTTRCLVLGWKPHMKWWMLLDPGLTGIRLLN